MKVALRRVPRRQPDLIQCNIIFDHDRVDKAQQLVRMRAFGAFLERAIDGQRSQVAEIRGGPCGKFLRCFVRHNSSDGKV